MHASMLICHDVICYVSEFGQVFVQDYTAEDRGLGQWYEDVVQKISGMQPSSSAPRHPLKRVRQLVV